MNYTEITMRLPANSMGFTLSPSDGYPAKYYECSRSHLEFCEETVKQINRDPKRRACISGGKAWCQVIDYGEVPRIGGKK